MSKRIDLKGKKYNRWTVLNFSKVKLRIGINIYIIKYAVKYQYSLFNAGKKALFKLEKENSCHPNIQNPKLIEKV